MKGIQLAAFILCFSLAIGILGGMGWFSWVGVQPDPGVDGERKVEDEADEVSASGEGDTTNDGVLGTVSAVMDVLNTLRYLTVQAGSTLTNLGVPAPIAYGVQVIVTFTVLITMVQVIRGMRFT